MRKQLVSFFGPQFRYDGFDSRTGKSRSGSIRASDKVDASMRLKNRKIMATKLEPATRLMQKSKELLALLEGLYLLIHAGTDLVEALGILEGQQGMSKTGNRQLSGILGELKAGKSFWKAAREGGLITDPFVVSLIHAGEKTGTLDKALEAAIYYLKTMDSIRSKVISAMIYPAIVSVVSAIAIIILTKYIIPVFAALYLKYGNSKLPLLTRSLISVTTFLNHHLIAIMGGILLLVILFWYLRAQASVRFLFDRLRLRLPLLGRIKRNLTGFKCFSTLHILTAAGVELVAALGLLRQSFDNTVFGEKLSKILESVMRGESFHYALQEADFFGNSELSIIKSGENAGNLKDSFALLSQYFQAHFEKNIVVFNMIIEPLFLVLISMIVGLILIALYLPMFNIVNVI